jgi:hypothetical protein
VGGLARYQPLDRHELLRAVLHFTLLIFVLTEKRTGGGK